MHQPGVVPLRPLTLGDIFGGALQTIRRNPEATIGMGLVVLTVMLVPSLLASLALTNALATLPVEDITVLVLLVNLLFSTLSSIALTGMIVHVVGEAVLGDRATLVGSWRAVRGRLPALIATMLLISLLSVLVLGAAVAAVVGLVLVLDGAGAGGGVALVILMILLFLALAVGILWAGCRVSLAPASVVLEQVGPWRGIVRAWQLTRGAQAWRVVGITLLAGLLVAIFSSMVQVPVTFATDAALGAAGVTITPVAPAVQVVDHLLQLVTGALTIPFSAGVTALLYLDQRIRREGLDITLVRAAQDRAATR